MHEAEHVHIDAECRNHLSKECTAEHWQGGRPDPDHPHHVHIDLATGVVSYMRYTQKELELLRKTLARRANAKTP